MGVSSGGLLGAAASGAGAFAGSALGGLFSGAAGSSASSSSAASAGGLFGSASSSNQSSGVASSGLLSSAGFGGSASSGASPGGFFTIGASTGGSVGGLLGGASTSTGGSLFSSTTSGGAGAGLFGGAASSGGVASPFGGAAASSGISGGLFGGCAASSGGAGAGLFGGGAAGSAPAGGLFGGGTAASSSGGLFGNAGASATESGSSFSSFGGAAFGAAPASSEGAGDAPEAIKAQEDRLRQLFKSVDTGGSGKINKRELILACKKDAGLHKCWLPLKDGTRDRFEEVFQGIDGNDDREISLDEFLTLFQKVTGRTAEVTKRPASAKRHSGLSGLTADVVAAEEQRPVRISNWKHRDVITDLFDSWDVRLRAQAKQVDAVTSKALAVDNEVTANVPLVRSIRKDQAELKADLEVAENSVHQIWEQQDGVLNLLAGLKESLGLSTVPAEEMEHSSRNENRVRGLEAQLEELTRQVRGLALETEEFQASRYVGPLDRVAYVLDAHSSELDLVQERLDAAERRLRDVTSI